MKLGEIVCITADRKSMTPIAGIRHYWTGYYLNLVEFEHRFYDDHLMKFRSLTGQDYKPYMIIRIIEMSADSILCLLGGEEEVHYVYASDVFVSGELSSSLTYTNR